MNLIFFKIWLVMLQENWVVISDCTRIVTLGNVILHVRVCYVRLMKLTFWWLDLHAICVRHTDEKKYTSDMMWVSDCSRRATAPALRFNSRFQRFSCVPDLNNNKKYVKFSWNYVVVWDEFNTAAVVSLFYVLQIGEQIFSARSAVNGSEKLGHALQMFRLVETDDIWR